MPRALTFAPLLLLLACGDKDTGDGPPGPQDGGSTGDGGGAGDGGGGGDDGGAVPVEGDCEDGADNDADGLADCLDSDCVDSWNCNLPATIDFSSQVFFDGNTIECEVWGIDVDVDIEDCQANATTELRWVESGPTCPTCDRTYSGVFTYSVETCSALIGVPAPTRVDYGFVFVDPRTRELWSPDTAGTWVYVDTLGSADGRTFGLTGSEPILDDPDDCDNGTQNLGTLNVDLQWVDR